MSEGDRQPCAFLPGIQLIVGPMFAGKTSELLRRAAELEVHSLSAPELHCVTSVLRVAPVCANAMQLVEGNLLIKPSGADARTAGGHCEVSQGHAISRAAGRHARRRLEGVPRHELLQAKPTALQSAHSLQRTLARDSGGRLNEALCPSCSRAAACAHWQTCRSEWALTMQA